LKERELHGLQGEQQQQQLRVQTLMQQAAATSLTAGQSLQPPPPSLSAKELWEEAPSLGAMNRFEEWV